MINAMCRTQRGEVSNRKVVYLVRENISNCARSLVCFVGSSGLGAPVGAETVRGIGERVFVDTFQDHLCDLLYQLVVAGWNSKGAPLSILFEDICAHNHRSTQAAVAELDTGSSAQRSDSTNRSPRSVSPAYKQVI